MTVTMPVPSATERPEPPLHEHAWRLQAVWHEDGVATEEFGCSGCGRVTFR
ncbi:MULTISPECIES: hypothetical protein [unclassified Nocardioides]|uniref:hypothetical protein n=1 Tax=unclassified Nocardioides TaxID=2615069 RepID=UPI000A448B8D|nr:MULTISPECIES: hypothetical protein [unclassified Nocardioides]